VSKLKFDVRRAQLSKLILNLANPGVLARNLPNDASAADIGRAVMQISEEIDRRFPLANEVLS